MVFVTVGSQKFQFNRLIRAIDVCVLSGLIKDKVFAQTGWSDYVPEAISSEPFLNHDRFVAEMESADIVIAHGGTGAIVAALKAGKRVIAVPRLSQYGEHVDDHQIQIVELFADAGLIVGCMDVSRLADTYEACLASEVVPYESNTGRFLSDLDKYLSMVCHCER